MASRLLSRGADINYRNKFDGATTLMVAIQLANKEAVKYILEQKIQHVDIHLENIYKMDACDITKKNKFDINNEFPQLH